MSFHSIQVFGEYEYEYIIILQGSSSSSSNSSNANANVNVNVNVKMSESSSLPRNLFPRVDQRNHPAPYLKSSDHLVSKCRNRRMNDNDNDNDGNIENATMTIIATVHFTNLTRQFL